ncbi:MAG TPA: sporulation integral membrane protein YtvI [Candidatus Blautia merdavium]|uniref:Sporulation integral membrane protein YtvI n=1 Tax=Candidatus Blautia merdavium TaxID=2838494 RepID=A0A9D2PP33_9FIRM|nr:sporulation integral membrane protein YtvI [Candidatus Blautia merdavium]
MKWKKYAKGILSFLITVVLVILGIVLGIQFLKFFMPFVIGWFIALIANPLVRILERKLKVARKHTSVLLIIGVLAALVGAFYLVGSKTAKEVGILIEQAPEIYSSVREDFQNAGKNLDKLLDELPQSVQESVDDFEKSIGEFTGDAVGKLSQITVNQAGDIAKSLPNILISIIFSVLSAYFFIADRDRILEFGRANTPQIIQEKWKMFSDSLKGVFGGYFKAQFKIMGVIALILFAGFLILGVKFAIVVAILIAFLDMLPFFGTGTALIPWAVFQLFSGDVRLAVGLVILYLVTQLVRRIIEPKLVGDSIGVNPLLTLIFMYIGYRISGVLGMILAVPIGAIVINFYKAGIFDGPINGLKEAADDFIKWLYRDERTS